MTKDTAYGDGQTVRRFATLIAARNPLRQQADDWAEGFNVSSGNSPGGQTGEHPDPVGRRVVGPAPDLDPPEDDPNHGKRQLVEGAGLAEASAHLAADIDQWIHTGNQLARRALRLLPDTHPVAEMLAKHRAIRQVAAGTCRACGRDVTGIRENPMLGIRGDRLKSGYCFGMAGNCYDRWVAAGRPDRVVFEKSSTHVSGEDETAECH